LVVQRQSLEPVINFCGAIMENRAVHFETLPLKSLGCQLKNQHPESPIPVMSAMKNGCFVPLI
jgi:hypothetical protein